MELGIILDLIVLSVGVSLGVGCATLAIVNFFVAIADGKIEETERNMMGIVYVVLRVAMGVILVAAFILSCFNIFSELIYLPGAFVTGLWTLIGILFLNALLMTKHIMPSTVGPALQASTWYTLGVTMTLFSLGYVGFSLFHFYLGYMLAILFAVGLVNGVMAILKHNKEYKKSD